MKKLFATARMLLMFSVFALWYVRAGAQAVPALENISSEVELDKASASLDTALFDAYNRCDLERFASFMADNVEFYHDQGGVTLELVAGKLQVYPMKGYDAVEMGVHRFHHPGHEDTERVGEGKFIHLWQYKDGAWKITRVISYYHHPATK